MMTTEKDWRTEAADRSAKIDAALSALGLAMTSICTNPGDYKTASDWRCVLSRGGRTFEAPKYSQGPAHRVWLSPSRVPANSGRAYAEGSGALQVIGKPGEPIPQRYWSARGLTLAESGALTVFTEPATPTLRDVLYSLVSDASMVRRGQSFADFCGDTGGDEDSIKCRASFDGCRDEWSGLIGLGLDLDALDELFRDY